MPRIFSYSQNSCACFRNYYYFELVIQALHCKIIHCIPVNWSSFRLHTSRWYRTSSYNFLYAESFVSDALQVRSSIWQSFLWLKKSHNRISHTKIAQNSHKIPTKFAQNSHKIRTKNSHKKSHKIRTKNSHKKNHTKFAQKNHPKNSHKTIAHKIRIKNHTQFAQKFRTKTFSIPFFGLTQIWCVTFEKLLFIAATISLEQYGYFARSPLQQNPPLPQKLVHRPVRSKYTASDDCRFFSKNNFLPKNCSFVFAKNLQFWPKFLFLITS